jgi:hypothetical protein
MNANESLSLAEPMNLNVLATSPSKQAASGLLSLVRLTAVSERRVGVACADPASTITVSRRCGISGS